MDKTDRYQRTERVRNARYARFRRIVTPLWGPETPEAAFGANLWAHQPGRWTKYNGACQCRACKAGRVKYSRAKGR